MDDEDLHSPLLINILWGFVMEKRHFFQFSFPPDFINCNQQFFLLLFLMNEFVSPG